MDTVLRALAIYVGLLVILRASGKRTLAQITSFDFVLLLILGEATQQALIGEDFSITTALILIGSLVAIDMGFALMKEKVPSTDPWLEGRPLIIVEDGRPLRERMDQVRVDDSDVMAAARERQGLERMEQIKYAVLERSGGISIIPR